MEDLLFSGVRKQWLILWMLLVLSGPSLRGSLSDEEKKRLFLEAREDIRPVPKPSTTPRPKPQPASISRHTSKPAQTPAAKKSTPEPPETPRPKPKPTEEPAETPVHKPAHRHSAETEQKKSSPKPETTEVPNPSGTPDYILLPGEGPNRPGKPPHPEKPAPSCLLYTSDAADE